MSIDLETLEAFDAAIAGGTLAGAFVQSLDLRSRTAALRSVPVTGAVFLGCDLTPSDRARLTSAGALIFPKLPDLPFNPYRTGLYTADELYAGLADGYAATPDARINDWWHEHVRPGELEAELACTLHDHCVTDALDEELASFAPTTCVGVMGGHAVERGSPGYAAAAQLGKALGDRGRLVVTGGGPGAMEAANLGGAFAGSVAELDAALAGLAGTTPWASSVESWAQAALAVRSRWDVSRPTLGVPTWFYGHEPPNAFATLIAKFFSNAIREDTLLTRCRGGLVYLPGAAGTVQEVFQAVTPNFYSREPAAITPLVFLGHDHWTRVVPVWPLVTALAKGRAMASRTHLVDSTDEALALLA